MHKFLSTLGLMVVFYFLFEILSRWSVRMDRQNRHGFLPNVVAMLAVINYYLSFAVAGLVMWHDSRVEKVHQRQFLEDRKPYEDVLQHQIDTLSAENDRLRKRIELSKAECGKSDYHLEVTRRAQRELVSAITQLLSLSQTQSSSFKNFVSLFTDSVQAAASVSIRDIDCFIDWMYESGLVTPSLDRYKQLGFSIVLTRKIYVPCSTRSLFPNWKDLSDRAFRAGILLTYDASAPSLEFWHTELRSFLPDLFEIDDLPSRCDMVLERIIQIAEESLDDRANLPDYIIRIAGIDFLSESDYLNNIDDHLEFLVRKYAHSINLMVEAPPEDFRGKLNRTANKADRFNLVQNWRA